jgi:hypothetical protein
MPITGGTLTTPTQASALVTLPAASRGHGVDGTCVARSAAIPVRPIIWRDPGPITDPTPVVRTSAPLWSGATTSERSSGRKMASGSSRAAMTAMPFGPVRGRCPAPSRSGQRQRPSRRDPGLTISVGRLRSVENDRTGLSRGVGVRRLVAQLVLPADGSLLAGAAEIDPARRIYPAIRRAAPSEGT